MKQREQWVRVESEGELRAGMTVEVRSALCCERNPRFILVGNGRLFAVHSDGILCDGLQWRTIGGCSCDRDVDVPDAACFQHFSLPDGRLFRLSDDLGDEQTEQVAAKRTERVGT